MEKKIVATKLEGGRATKKRPLVFCGFPKYHSLNDESHVMRAQLVMINHMIIQYPCCISQLRVQIELNEN